MPHESTHTATLVTSGGNVVEGVGERVRVKLRGNVSSTPRNPMEMDSLTAGFMNPMDICLSTSLLTMTQGIHVPTGPLPAVIRASLMRVINEPTTGAEHEVPKTRSNSPATADNVTSGLPLLHTLPRKLTYDVVGTADLRSA